MLKKKHRDSSKLFALIVVENIVQKHLDFFVMFKAYEEN